MATNSDLHQKWQQAIQGVEAAKNDLAPEELSAFDALVTLLNSGNFEASESAGYIQVIKNALTKQFKNRLLKAHLTNFVTLCEKHFAVQTASATRPSTPTETTVTEPQPQTFIAPSVKSPVSPQKPQAVGKPKKRNILIPVIIAVAVVIVGAALFFVFGKTDTIRIPMKTGKTTDILLIPVTSNGEKWGYINHKGEYVINPQFDDADFFSDGLAKVWTRVKAKSDGKIGYINTNGEFVVPAIYREGTEFNGGLAFVVAEGGRLICIDKNGNTKFVLKEAEYVSAFSEGLALFITEDEKRGFVDRNGNVVITAQFAEAMPFSGGFARISLDGKFYADKVTIGFIDKTGKIVINPQFRDVGNFSEGMAAFFDGSQWGYINTKGAYAINPQFQRSSKFSSGLAAALQGEAWGYINKTGKFLINPQFDYASPFSDGLAAVRRGESVGYINKKGEYVINPQFTFVDVFNNGIAPVRSHGGNWGFINKKGQYIVNPQFQNIKISDKISHLQHPRFIQSQYYDTSEFIKLFFERENGNTFDGVNASTTLEYLSSHPVYANVEAQWANNAIYSNEIPLTKDISIHSVQFYFSTTPIYKDVISYDRWGYRTGTRREWNFNAKPDAIIYHFSLKGKAMEKLDVVMKDIKTEIEKRQGKMMISHESEFIHYLLQENGKLSYTVFYNGDFVFIVDFNGKFISEQFKSLIDQTN